MTRIEIIANKSVEEDILKELTASMGRLMFSKINGVQGIGKTFPKMGDPIWPEENFILIIYCKSGEAENVRQAVQRVKKAFPNEGIKYFKLKSSDNG